MSLGTRLLLPALVVLTPLQAGPPPANFAASQALQMQMQMSRARLAAQQAQRRLANEQAARLKNAPPAEEIAKPVGEAWRFPLPPGGNRAEDTSLVMVVGEKWMIARSRDKAADLWSAAVEGGFESGPVLSNGLVLYTTSDYRCVALEKDSGKRRYQVQLEALRKFFSADNNKTKVQFPIIEGKRVYLATCGKGTDGEAAGKLYAVDLDTGTKVWEAPLAAGADHPPVILGDRILVGGAPLDPGLPGGGRQAPLEDAPGPQQVGLPGRRGAGALLSHGGQERHGPRSGQGRGGLEAGGGVEPHRG